MNITAVDGLALFIAEAIAEIGGYLLIAACLSFVAAAFGLFPWRGHQTRSRAWRYLLGTFVGLLTAFFAVPVAYFLAPALLVLAPFASALTAYWAARRLAS